MFLWGRKGEERGGKERKGEERGGKERKGEERGGKGRKGKGSGGTWHDYHFMKVTQLQQLSKVNKPHENSPKMLGFLSEIDLSEGLYPTQKGSARANAYCEESLGLKCLQANAFSSSFRPFTI